MRTALADSHGCMWIHVDLHRFTRIDTESHGIASVAQTVMQARVRDCAAIVMAWGTTEHSEAKVAKASQGPRAFPRSVVDHRGHRVTCPVRCDSVSVGSRVRRAGPQNGASPLTVCDGAQSAEFGTGRGGEKDFHVFHEVPAATGDLSLLPSGGISCRGPPGELRSADCRQLNRRDMAFS